LWQVKLIEWDAANSRETGAKVFRDGDVVLAAEQGLRRLIEGNKRFVAGKARFPTVCKETLAALIWNDQSSTFLFFPFFPP
jgi:hypothetical protein